VYNSYVENLYSVKEAAGMLGLDPSQVRRLLAKGEIKGKKLDRDWVVLSLDYKRKRKLRRISPPQLDLLDALNNGWELKTSSDGSAAWIRKGNARQSATLVRTKNVKLSTVHALLRRGLIEKFAKGAQVEWIITPAGRKTLERSG
jgi:hypothetical protein